jgi:hypothetical protein
MLVMLEACDETPRVQQLLGTELVCGRVLGQRSVLQAKLKQHAAASNMTCLWVTLLSDTPARTIVWSTLTGRLQHTDNTADENAPLMFCHNPKHSSLVVGVMH